MTTWQRRSFIHVTISHVDRAIDFDGWSWSRWIESTTRAM